MKTNSSVLIVLCLLLSACSSRPSASSGRQAILATIKSQSQGRITLVDFRKTDGAEGELNGLPIYHLEFSAEIAFTEHCKWLTGLLRQHITLRTVKAVNLNQQGIRGVLAVTEDASNPGMVVERGQEAQLVGDITYVKKETGWVVESFQISTAHLLSDVRPSAPRVNAAKHESGSVRLGGNDYPTEDSIRMAIAKSLTIPPLEASLSQAVKSVSFSDETHRTVCVLFNAQIIFRKDTPFGEVVAHKGDTLDVTGSIACHRSSSGWEFDRPQGEDIVSSSNPDLLTTLKREEEAAKSNACIGNLRQIDGAKQQWALEQVALGHRIMTVTPTKADLLPYLVHRQFPSCPDGGVYSINAIDKPPTCSIAGHALP